MFFSTLGVGVFCYGLFYTICLAIFDCDVQLGFYKLFGKPIERLKGKVVFITGASSGIGEFIAVALAKRGVKLVLTARRAAELERVKRTCIEVSKGQLNPQDVLVLVMDVLDIESHKNHFQYALEYFGRIDILVNNAGRSQRAAWENIDLAVDRQVFELNLFSVINLSRIAVKYFETQGTGHVAATSSLAGVIGAPFSGTYTGSKHALHGYYNSLRNEKYGTGLTVTLLCPGPTFTNFLAESFTDKDGQKYGVSTQPTDRRMTAERCGELCAVSLANRLNESWIALFPIVPLTYFAVYCPTTFKCGLKLIGAKKLFKLRDSKETIVPETRNV